MRINQACHKYYLYLIRLLLIHEQRTAQQMVLILPQCCMMLWKAKTGPDPITDRKCMDVAWPPQHQCGLQPSYCKPCMPNAGVSLPVPLTWCSRLLLEARVAELRKSPALLSRPQQRTACWIHATESPPYLHAPRSCPWHDGPACLLPWPPGMKMCETSYVRL